MILTGRSPHDGAAVCRDGGTYGQLPPGRSRDRDDDRSGDARLLFGAEYRAWLRAWFRETIKYAPRGGQPVAGHIVRDVRRIRDLHTQSITRENLFR